MSPKEYIFEELDEAYRELKVWDSKLKDMFKATPVFWYSLGIVTTQEGKYRVNIDMGKLTELNVDLDDIKMS